MSPVDLDLTCIAPWYGGITKKTKKRLWVRACYSQFRSQWELANSKGLVMSCDFSDVLNSVYQGSTLTLTFGGTITFKENNIYALFKTIQIQYAYDVGAN